MRGIILQELCAMRFMIIHSFSKYVCGPDVQHVLLHSDNPIVGQVINSMISGYPERIYELRKLNSILVALGMHIQVRCMRSDVKKLAEAWSRTWRPDDLTVYEHLVQDLLRHHHLDEVQLFRRPLNDHYSIRCKYLRELLAQPWDDGRSHLWLPLADLIPFVVDKIMT